MSNEEQPVKVETEETARARLVDDWLRLVLGRNPFYEVAKTLPAQTTPAQGREEER